MVENFPEIRFPTLKTTNGKGIGDFEGIFEEVDILLWFKVGRVCGAGIRLKTFLYNVTSGIFEFF